MTAGTAVLALKCNENLDPRVSTLNQAALVLSLHAATREDFFLSVVLSFSKDLLILTK